uniref:Uncharacterized protein n=1 Tax=Anguilla anguilla TaxID=7936 RepID=A0A0E9PFK1_ANGAN
MQVYCSLLEKLTCHCFCFIVVLFWNLLDAPNTQT